MCTLHSFSIAAVNPRKDGGNDIMLIYYYCRLNRALEEAEKYRTALQKAKGHSKVSSDFCHSDCLFVCLFATLLFVFTVCFVYLL